MSPFPILNDVQVDEISLSLTLWIVKKKECSYLLYIYQLSNSLLLAHWKRYGSCQFGRMPIVHIRPLR